MIRLASGKLIILAAGKVTAENLSYLSIIIHTDEFHGRKIVGDLI
jgi:copper homeostasis protein